MSMNRRSQATLPDLMRLFAATISRREAVDVAQHQYADINLNLAYVVLRS